MFSQSKNPICVICKKEFKSFIFSPGYFITLGVFFGIMCYIYLLSFSGFINAVQRGPVNPFGGGPVNFHSSVISQYVGFISFLFIFITPVLIARIISEDKKLYSFDLLMTSPLSSASIIAGKFFGGLMAIWLIILVTMIYPLSATLFVDVEWSKFLSAYLGLFLVSGIYTSSSLFCSSFTNSFPVAIISGFILNICFLIVSSFSNFYMDNAILTDVLEHISLNQHINHFVTGNLQLSSIVFCITIIGFFCFLSERVIEASRWRG